MWDLWVRAMLKMEVLKQPYIRITSGIGLPPPPSSGSASRLVNCPKITNKFKMIMMRAGAFKTHSVTAHSTW